MTRMRQRVVRCSWGAVALGVLLTLTGCSSPPPGATSSASTGNPATELPARTEPAATDAISTAPVDEASVAAHLQQGIPAERLPGGFHLVDQITPDGDTQPAQVFATAAYEASLADATLDQGPTVIVRTVPRTPEDRANAPTTISPEVTAEPRDDIAPGAVIYLLEGADVPSITVPAGDVDFVIAGTDVDIDTLVAFTRVVLR